MMSFLVLFAAVLLHGGDHRALGLPQEQQNAENPLVDVGTCDTDQFASQFSTPHLACVQSAEEDLDRLLARRSFEPGAESEDLAAPVCQQLEQKLGCLRENGPACFSPEDVEYLQGDLLATYFQQVLQLPMGVGLPVVRDCPILSDNAEDLVFAVTGSDACSVEEYEASLREERKCEKAAFELKDYKLEFLRVAPNAKELVFEAYCHLRDTLVDSCRPIGDACLGEDEIAALNVEEEKSLFPELEAEVGEADFSFATSCRFVSEELAIDRFRPERRHVDTRPRPS